MLFNTATFLVFFVVVLLLYSKMRWRQQNYMLLVASYIFYGWWDWRFLTLLAATTVLDWYLALRIERAHELSDSRAAKSAIVASVIANLAVLGFFKYCNFFIDSAEVTAFVRVPRIDVDTEGHSAGRYLVLHLPVDVVTRSMCTEDNCARRRA